MRLDLQVFNFLNSFAGQSEFFDSVFIFFAKYLPYFLVAGFLMYLIVWRKDTKEKISLFAVSLISMTVSRLGITELVRFFYHRPRPFIFLKINPLLIDTHYSFPSGHAAFFFALATSVYFFNKKAGLIFFIASAVISISRIIAGVHYLTDIIGGALIGIVTAYIVFKIWTSFHTVSGQQRPIKQ